MPAQAGIHASIGRQNDSCVDRRLRGDDVPFYQNVPQNPALFLLKPLT